MGREAAPGSLIRLIVVGFLTWISMLGFDFLLHAGVLASFYVEPGPFLLPPLEAFQRIPLGYLSFLILDILLLWLIVRLGISGWRAGARFGLTLGAALWGAQVLGLASITTAPGDLLAGWFIGQTLELGVAGAIAGSGMAGARLGHLSLVVMAILIVAIIITVLLQTFGLAPTVRL